MVKACCSMSKYVKLIHSCSDRQNIRLSIAPVQTKSAGCFNWLMEWLIEKQVECPKVLIYCNSHNLVSWLFGQFESFLGNDIYLNGVKDPKNLYVNMFHSEGPEFVKNRCLKSLTSSESILPRVVIATSAIGCGINVKNLRYVCHFGPAYSLVDYCQQIGRAGRNNEPDCHAILYTYPSSSKKINPQMKAYTKLTNTCLRTELFSPFNDSKHVPPLKIGHDCCSICTLSCTCGTDHNPLFKFEKENEFLKPLPKVPVREVSETDRESIKILLEGYHRHCLSESLNLPSSSISGLTENIVTTILNDLEYINSPEFLIDNLCILDFNVAKRIFEIISKFYLDKELNDFFDIDMEIEPIKPANSDMEIGQNTENVQKYTFSDFEDSSDIDDIDLEY